MDASTLHVDFENGHLVNINPPPNVYEEKKPKTRKTCITPTFLFLEFLFLFLFFMYRENREETSISIGDRCE